MREVVIAAYGRSPLFKARKGSVADVHPVEYGAQVLNGVLDKIPQLKKEDIDDVITGCAIQEKYTSMNLSKNIAARAGMPECVSAFSINRFCSSGLQAIAVGTASIMANQADVVVAGGVEDMSKTFEPYSKEYMDTWLVENDEGAYMAMGITAENVAEKYGISREEMDAMAVESHKKAHEAQKAGKLAPSIIPIHVTDAEGNEHVYTEDEGIRPGTSMASLANLKPCFKENGRVTAATSSQTTDGAGYVVLMTKEKAEELGIKPIAKLVSFSVAGCDSKMMGLGPMYAVPKAMKRAGLSVKDMDVIEINEAFAAQAIPCIRELKFDPAKVNPYGGALALGHPLGATGAVLTCKALDYLADNNGKYALVTMCIGGGMGAAGIFERL